MLRVLLLFFSFLYATSYTTITVNGTNSGWSSDETFTDVSDADNVYITWDATNIYVGISDAEADYNNIAYFMYFDTDPTGSNGTTDTYTWGNNITTPFSADYVLAFKYNSTEGSAYIEFRDYDDSGSSWSQTGQTSSYTYNTDNAQMAGGTDYLEFKIKRSILNVTNATDKIRFCMLAEQQWGSYWRYFVFPGSSAIGNRGASQSIAAYKSFTLNNKFSPNLSTLHINGSVGFRLMSTPVSNGTYTDLLAELWTQGMTGSDAAGAADDNVWGFTLGSGAAGSWSGVSNLSATMTPGAGFLVYVFTDTDNDGDNDLPVNLSVSGSENSGNVTYPASGSIDASQYGLAGNPYYTTIDFDDVTRNNVEATVYVYDDAKSGGAGYINWNGSSGDLTNGLIAPFQGFWVQATGSGSASIQIQTADKSTSSGTFYRMLDTEEIGGMHLDFASDNGGYSKTWFSYRSDGEVGKDSRDAHRLMPLMATSRLAAMSFVEDNSLDINNLPFDHGSDIHVPLDVMSLQLEDGQYVTSAAEVTIGWDISQLPDHIDLTLIDELTGEHIDLRHELSYTFTTEPKGSFNADYDTEVSPYPQVGESRFTLHTSYGALDNKHEVVLPGSYALDPIYPNPFNPRATVRFDVPEVSRVELEVYDITGSLVETLLDEKMVPGGHQYIWEPKSLSTGVYFLRLITANQTFTQKVTYVK